MLSINECLTPQGQCSSPHPNLSQLCIVDTSVVLTINNHR